MDVLVVLGSLFLVVGMHLTFSMMLDHEKRLQQLEKARHQEHNK